MSRTRENSCLLLSPFFFFFFSLPDTPSRFVFKITSKNSSAILDPWSQYNRVAELRELQLHQFVSRGSCFSRFRVHTVAVYHFIIVRLLYVRSVSNAFLF